MKMEEKGIIKGKIIGIENEMGEKEKIIMIGMVDLVEDVNEKKMEK